MHQIAARTPDRGGTKREENVRKFGLVTKFTVLSLMIIGGLGFLLAQSVAGEIRFRALSSATETAVVSSRLGIQPQLTADGVRNGLSPEALSRLDRSIRSNDLGTAIFRIHIWDTKGRLVYSDDATQIGHTFPLDDHLREALAGHIASEVSSLQRAENARDRKAGHLLEVYVPMIFAGDRMPAGIFELYVPYQPISAAIHHDTMRLYTMLTLGLGLLWLALSRIVLGASRRLRDQAADNQHQALHDSLTGLPNRALFDDRLRQAVTGARRTGSGVTVMLMDLDRFKEVNNTLGHTSGDALLRQIGPRLRPMLRGVDTVARLGGDEFAVLLPGMTDPESALAVAGEMRHLLSKPFPLEDISIELEASVGVALYPDHGTDAETVMGRADAAMHRAKSISTGVEFYQPGHDGYSRDRLNLVGELRRGIDAGELVLHYQPKADLRTGRIDSVEALVRWQHPDRGLVPPDDFIPLAEHTGLIRPLTHLVLDQALGQCAAWRREGRELMVAVNLSVRSLHDLRLPDEVRTLLAVHGLPATCLQLEITESTLMADPERAIQVVAELHAMGIELAVDDFGTGYSSLAYLHRLQVSAVKIDKSFVIGLDTEDSGNAVIIRSTIDLARNLGLEVIAEGVETEAALRRLSALGCDLAQGFYLCRPVPADDLVTWLEGRTILPVG